MNNDELKKKIVSVLRENMEYELQYYPDDNYTEVEIDYGKLADALIAAGIGDVKTVREIGASASAMAVFEAAKAEHRAEVAEKMFDILHEESSMYMKVFSKEWYKQQAEKELAEGRKDENN